jgi:hypothetical protein
MLRDGERIKKILFATTLALLFVPVVQQKTQLVDEGPLRGTVIAAAKPAFSLHNWLNDSATYQGAYERYINEKFGFRNLFVRLHNQIAFMLFHKANAKDVIIGKENYLYEDAYIRAYYGSDAIEDSVIDGRLRKAKFVQDTLRKLHVDLLLIYAPGKASFLPEFIPEAAKPLRTFRSNYSRYLQTSIALGLTFIDYHAWFAELKQTAPYPLYPQYGIHWSSYGRDLVLDSLTHYLEGTRHVALHSVTRGGLVLSDSLRESDSDIGDGLNLMFKLRTFPMAYSSYAPGVRLDRPELRVLTIADSYWWRLFDLGIAENLFRRGKFWYYNREVYPESYTSPTAVCRLDLQKEIEGQDVIIVMATDANLPKFGWGFIENAYDVYAKGRGSDRTREPACTDSLRIGRN